jgi:hypothetical protein
VCSAQYQRGDLPRVKEKVRRDGSQRSQEAKSVGIGNSRLKRLVADEAVQIHILKEVNAEKW